MKKTTTINGEMKEITIQCDLIVHSRGTNKQRDNLIAVEMKKSYQTQECKEIKGCGSLKEGGKSDLYKKCGFGACDMAEKKIAFQQ